MKPLAIGERLHHYRILEKLGQGGMGEVFKAEDERLGRLVAIKLLPVEERPADDSARERLLREARSASALRHPGIVTIHAVEEDGGRDFIVMEFVEGEPLSARLRRGLLSCEELVALGTDAAEALAAAHSAGLVHRDIKPANIAIDKHGRARILDFGLAKKVVPEASDSDTRAATATAALTTSGAIVGTVSYMSPEQARAEELDGKSDVFSLGCTLYEAATGRRPFNGASTLALLNEITSSQPPPPRRLRPELPAAFEKALDRSLAKRKEARLSAHELASELRALGPASTATGALPRPGVSVRFSRPVLVIGACVLVAAGMLIFASVRRAARLAEAQRSAARVAELAGRSEWAEAFALANRVLAALPDEPAVRGLMPTISDEVSVESEPAGARATLRRYGAPESEAAIDLGATPVRAARVARADYLLTLEKDGYAPFVRTISSSLTRRGAEIGLPNMKVPIDVRTSLGRTGATPGMVPVPGGDYRLVSVGHAFKEPAMLRPFLIDRAEVTNKEYREFVAAGGYQRRELWAHPITRDGREVPWEEALSAMKDRTSLPGPRGWVNGSFPEGQAEHPVTGVTWYEAAAYAAFRGKRLPTIFEWEKAARDGAALRQFGIVMPWGWALSEQDVTGRANFRGKGTQPAGALPFGASPYGCLDMAGNAAEWCANPRPSGFATTGGSWRDIPYEFGRFGDYPGLHASDRIGFRCAKSAGTGEEPAAAFIAKEEPIVLPPPVRAEALTAWTDLYRYDKTPLDAKVEEVTETENYRRERVTFRGAGEKRVPAALYLPKSGRPPYSVIHLSPSAGAFAGFSLERHVHEVLLPYLAEGRAVLTVALEGYSERPFEGGGQLPAPSSVKNRELVVAWATDRSRSIDYLETRKDIDARRIAYYGISLGASQLVFPAVEPRYRSLVLVSAGLRRSWTEIVPEASPVNFAPLIRQPKLLVNGRYDEAFDLKNQVEPLYAILPEPKRLVVYDGGHVPTPEQSVPAISAFLTETLGPAR